MFTSQTRKSIKTIAPGVEKIVEKVQEELAHFFYRDSHHSAQGRLAHVYFEPANCGVSRYEQRELLSIEALPGVVRMRVPGRVDSDLREREFLESTDLKVDVGLSNPHRPSFVGHVQVCSVRDAFAEFLNCCSFMLETASDGEVRRGQSERPKPAMTVTMILSTSAGPLAILVGDSHKGTLTEDRQALMQARILNARHSR